jgi:branched-chain amino acid aminotransferase
MTPPDNIGALVGITQRTVIGIAKRQGISFSYQNMRLDDIYGADECFLTGTAAEIIPVVKMDNKPIGDGKPGKITKQLLEEFHKFTKTNGVRY